MPDTLTTGEASEDFSGSGFGCGGKKTEAGSTVPPDFRNMKLSLGTKRSERSQRGVPARSELPRRTLQSCKGSPSSIQHLGLMKLPGSPQSHINGN